MVWSLVFTAYILGLNKFLYKVTGKGKFNFINKSKGCQKIQVIHFDELNPELHIIGYPGSSKMNEKIIVVSTCMCKEVRKIE